MYQRGFSTLGCGELTLAEVRALGRKHGIDRVELRALGGSLDLTGQLARECGSPSSFATQSSGGWIAALGTSCRLIGAAAGERANLLEHARWADAAGVAWLRIFDGGRDLNHSELAEAREFFRWWQAIRAEQRIRADVLVETHDSLLDSDRIQHWQTGLDRRPAALLWDAHHTWKKGGEDPLATWAAIRAQVVHVHVKDSLPDTAARPGYHYVLPGTGNFPMAALQRKLAAEFQGVVSLEWERWWQPELPPLEEALAAAYDRRWW